MSDFSPGFVGRHALAAEALQRAFALPEMFAPSSSFQPIDLTPDNEGTVEPRHFSPADRDHNPTEGWDPMAPAELTLTDQIAAARAAGYEEGLAAGRAEADAAQQRESALLEQVSTALAAGAHFDRERMAGHLRQTVLHLVTRMVGETGVAPDVLNRRVAMAVDMLADQAESAILRVNPEDLPLVEGKLPERIFAAADPHLARGAFVIESASTMIEDGPEVWLEQLAQAIERIPLPPEI